MSGYRFGALLVLLFTLLIGGFTYAGGIISDNLIPMFIVFVVGTLIAEAIYKKSIK